MRKELKNITAKKLIAILIKDGFYLSRTKGSHRIYRHKDGRRVVLPFHHYGDTFPPGTLNDIIKAAQWSEEDFIKLKLIKRRS